MANGAGSEVGPRLARWLWAAGILAASIPPRAVKAHLHTSGTLHTISHVAAFALGAVLAGRPGRGDGAIARSIVWLTAWALASEVSEAALYANQMEWNDVGSDLAGVFAGLTLWHLRQISFSRTKVNGHDPDSR
jgi:hypothetical protein